MTYFKELCIDTTRSGRELGQFWASVTGCSYVEASTPDDSGDVVAHVEGEVEGMGIAICRVPEEKSAKHRVHFDVRAGSVDSLATLGARPAPGYVGDGWTVLLDPEGGEFCAFVREGELASYRMYEVVVDAAEPERIARWWAEVFSVPVCNEGQAWWWVEDVAGMPFESLVFQPVPEPKTVKNRIHWDLYGDADDLVGRGATVLAELPNSTVLADPEGNEFCVFAPVG